MATLLFKTILQLIPFLLLLLEYHQVESNTPPGLMRLANDFQSKPRERRRVGNLDVTSGAVEYMKKLREDMESSSDNANVYCILDKDLVNNVHRPKSPSSRCTTINRYIYSLKSIAEIEDLKKLPLRKSVIRAHLQVIPRLLKSYPVTVNITTTARLLSHDISQFVVAGRDRISVTADSNGWIELNVTEGLKTLLPLALSTNTSDDLNIEFLVTQQVDCTKTKKVPAAFVEPTSIKLSQEKRRERHLPLQALLLIYATDEDIVKDQHVIAQSEEEENQKQKRSASRACHRESYQIRFSELQLNYILAPAMYNAYRCVGGCTHQQLSANSRLATNHALLMASAKFVSDLPNSNIAFPRRPRDPLCSPTRYESLPILISIANDMVDIEHYPSMKVTECGCR